MSLKEKFSGIQHEGELPQLSFDGFSDWFIKINDPFLLWELQPTYILSQVTFLIGAFLTFIHAVRNGQRLPYLWLASIFHGLVIEAVSYNLQDIDSFWHAQAPVMFIGRRLPLYIIGLYSVFIYQASVAVSRMKLPTWAEPFAVGLVTILIDIPYDIVGIKFIHWTWQDTDPNIEDRHYWVPWNSYYFHLCFTASFTFWFHFWHRWIGQQKKWQANRVSKEVVCAVLTGLLGMPGGVLLFIPLYHPLHDEAHIHSEVTFFMLFSVAVLIVWSADRIPKYSSDLAESGGKWTALLIGGLIAHYSLFLGMVLFGNPENEMSIGLHEPIGPCNETISLVTPFGSVLKKRKYLCPSDYDEGYADIECSLKRKVFDSNPIWYAMCGTPFENRTEYVAIIGTICLMAFIVFSNLYSTRILKFVPKKNE